MKNFAKPILVLIAGIVVGGLLLSATPAFSQGIVGSKHDMTFAGNTQSTTDTTEVCVFCHSPHGVSGQPLWNRGVTTSTYTMYNSAWSATMDMTIAGQPQGVSAACLTCHDGTVAYDNLINATTTTAGNGYTAGGAVQGWTFTGGLGNNMAGIGAPTELGTDLTDDHPISITYDPAADTGNFFPIANVRAALQLYNAPASTAEDQVECGTCHDPHNATLVPFLRMDNAASAMCTTCHNK